MFGAWLLASVLWGVCGGCCSSVAGLGGGRVVGSGVGVGVDVDFVGSSVVVVVVEGGCSLSRRVVDGFGSGSLGG